MQCPFCNEGLADGARFCGACGSLLSVEETPPVDLSRNPDSNVGRVIAQRYELHERIGAGSVGALYAATQLGNGRKVAVKLLHNALNADPQLLRRFRREGRLLCRLHSSHTVTTYEFDHDADGTPYIAMEYPAGPSLAEVLELEGAVGWVRTLRILSGLCDALAEAHDLGVVHRDLRPENCVLESRLAEADFVRVLDFGLAQLTNADAAISHPGQTIGATAYASPEQLQKRPIDARSDIYGLGVLAYQLLTGKHPFADAKSPGELVAAHLQRKAPPPSATRAEIPTDVDEIVARCLEKDPERRFPNAQALDAMINIVLLGLASTTGDTIKEPPRAVGEEDTAIATPPRARR